MKSRICFLAAAFSIVFSGCASWNGIFFPTPSTVLRETFRDSSQASETIEYCLSTFPDAGAQEKFPFLFAFHGTGSDGCQYLTLWKKEADHRRFMILSTTRASAFQNEASDLAIFSNLLDEVLKRHPIDSKRIVLVGSSSGALVARWLLVERPAKWSAAVFISSPAYESWLNERAAESFPPVLFVHGQEDRQTDWETAARHAAELRKKGMSVAFFLIPASGHTHEESWNASIMDWIAGRRPAGRG